MSSYNCIITNCKLEKISMRQTCDREKKNIKRMLSFSHIRSSNRSQAFRMVLFDHVQVLHNNKIQHSMLIT